MQPCIASAVQQTGDISTPPPGVKSEPAVGPSFAAQEFCGQSQCQVSGQPGRVWLQAVAPALGEDLRFLGKMPRCA